MGFARGIWVLWNRNTVTMEPITTSFQEVHLHCQVSNKYFLLTAIYTSPLYVRRKLLSSSFINLAPLLNLPCLIIGDYNDIANANEKFGGRHPSQEKLNNFDSLITFRLTDLGYIGLSFTWTNR